MEDLGTVDDVVHIAFKAAIVVALLVGIVSLTPFGGRVVNSIPFFGESTDRASVDYRAQLAGGSGLFGGKASAVPFYKALLRINPLHPGANHELVHYYEGSRRPAPAPLRGVRSPGRWRYLRAGSAAPPESCDGPFLDARLRRATPVARASDRGPRIN